MAYNIYLFDQRQWRIAFLGGNAKTLKNWALGYGGGLIFNLSIFQMSTGRICTYLKTPGGTFQGDRYSDIVAIGDSAAAGYSNAIKNGIVHVDYPMGGARTRNGIGLTRSGKFIVAQSSSKVTERTFAEAVNGFVRARNDVVDIFILQDGGGSTGEYSGLSRLSFAPEGGRKVPAVVQVWPVALPKVIRTLSKGKKGDDIALLQTVLGGIEADGVFGAGTKNRVKAAQKALGLVADGIAGPMTLARLGLR